MRKEEKTGEWDFQTKKQLFKLSNKNSLVKVKRITPNFTFKNDLTFNIITLICFHLINLFKNQSSSYPIPNSGKVETKSSLILSMCVQCMPNHSTNTNNLHIVLAKYTVISIPNFKKGCLFLFPLQLYYINMILEYYNQISCF